MARANKGYTDETIAKVRGMLADAIAEYRGLIRAGQHFNICISKGNRKIGRVMNVSIAPLLTCKNCKGCQHFCYDIKAVLLYGNVLQARAKNTALLWENRDEYFRQIEDAISRRRLHKFFRWHVAGEIPDIDYLNRMIEIARRHPDFTLWTYTKMYGIVNNWCKQHGKESIPANMHIMFSEWRGMPIINPYGFPEFRVVFPDDVTKPDPRKVHYCPGSCDVCIKAGRGCVAGETTYCFLH